MSELEKALARREKYETALDRISNGQNYSVDGMSVSRANLAEVEQTLSRINRNIKELRRQASAQTTMTKRARWS